MLMGATVQTWAATHCNWRRHGSDRTALTLAPGLGYLNYIIINRGFSGAYLLSFLTSTTTYQPEIVSQGTMMDESQRWMYVPYFPPPHPLLCSSVFE